MYQRPDLSDKLIHFVRAVNRGDDDYTLSEMHSYEFALGELVEQDLISPFFILRRILRKLQVLSTWSYRNGKSTIWGKYPATCFTDMPISSFVATSIERLAKNQKISNYALVFDKKQMFEIGARPVIYGTTKGEELPESEKYRFVSYEPNRTPYPIDWTHEREWRWGNFDYVNKNIPWFDDPDLGLDEETKELIRLRDEERVEFHGLNLDKHPLTNIGFILKSEDQAKLILRDILLLIDQKKIKRNLFTYVLFFPDLEKNIKETQNEEFINELIIKGKIEIPHFFEVDHKQKEELISNLNDQSNKLLGKFGRDDFNGGITGKSFPCFNDNLSNAARLLVGTDFIIITKLGRYLINLPCLNQTNSMEINENFVRNEINPALSKILGITLTYYSIGSISMAPIDTIGIDDVPFYTDPNSDEWNNAHVEEDF